MLTKFAVSNFKNFSSRIEFDLSRPGSYEFNSEAVKNGVVSKGLIYGPNGSGKSNLGLAIFDITRHLTDKQAMQSNYQPWYLNLDSRVPTAKFEYEFVFSGKKVVYVYEKNNLMQLVSERLMIDGREVVYYDFVKQTGRSLLKDTENLNLVSDRSLISRVKFIKNNTILSKDDVECAVFTEFTDYVDRMLLFYSLNNTEYQGFAIGADSITGGIVRNKKTKDFENFLRKCGVDYDLCEAMTPNGHMELFVKFKDTGNTIYFMQVASTGTRSLAIFYYWFIMMKDKASFVMIDEFDAFYHYKPSEIIVETLKELTDTQIFLTTHNTDLLNNDLLRPDCYFILNDGKINSLNNLTDKDIRKAHNLQKMYKAGVFDE